MSFGKRNSVPLSAIQLLAALLILLSVSLSLSSKVFANHCDVPCQSESNEGNKDREDGDCDACVCCLPAVKLLVPAYFDAGVSCGDPTISNRSTALNNISAPPDEIDHPPQNLQ